MKGNKMKTKRRLVWPIRAASFSARVLSLTLASAAFGQEAKPADKYVTREEYDKVVKELDTIKKRLGVMDEQKTAQDKETEQTQDDFDKQLKQIKSLATRLAKARNPRSTPRLIPFCSGN